MSRFYNSKSLFLKKRINCEQNARGYLCLFFSFNQQLSMFWHLVENMNITKYISIKNIRLRVANIFYLKILMLYFDLFSLIPGLNFVL